MTHINENLEVAFSTKQMYELVNDVEAYPEFIPACKAASISQRQENSLDAELLLGKGGFTCKLKTRNTFYPYKRIDLNLLSGPFSSLQGTWTFTEQNNNSSIVQMNLDFQLKNKLFSLAFNKIFQKISKELVESFYQRAQKLYA